MSENKSSKMDFLYNLFKAVVFIGVPVGSYFILDWGFLQILGAIIVMMVAFEIDEKGPIWRRWMWSLFSYDVMILGHFFIDDSVMNWGLVLLSVLLIFIIVMILVGIKDYKTGDGSTITVYVLGLIIVVPITAVVIYKSLGSFGYL